MSGTALITGAAAGLGRALAEQLLGDGWTVHGVDRDQDGLSTYGANFVPYMADLSDRASLNSLAVELSDFKFDLVIHNAGISATGRFEDIEPAAHARLLAVNVHAPVFLTNALLAAAAFEPKARLVFVSSLSHATGYPGAASYGASKDAIAAYGASLRKRLRADAIKVGVVFPGPLRTEHAQRHAPEGADASKRMTPEQAAKIILAGAHRGQAKIYPGGAAKFAAIAGKLAPGGMGRLMRRIIYDKLDRTVAD
ncbi:MAG: SDR family NAD(P)-dependent oxidoreductase [Pseudomonadota bacterium]